MPSPSTRRLPAGGVRSHCAVWPVLRAPLVLGAARPPPDSELLKQRYMKGAALRLGPYLRVYGEVWHAE